MLSKLGEGEQTSRVDAVTKKQVSESVETNFLTFTFVVKHVGNFNFCPVSSRQVCNPSKHSLKYNLWKYF